MEKTKKTFLARCYNSTREIRNATRLVGWILAWSVSLVGVKHGIDHEWLPADGPTFLATLISTGIGLGMILGYRRFLREADELQRKIQLDALALSLGVALVGTATYKLIERAGVVADADISNIVLLISVTYLATFLFGQRRYS